MRVSRIGVLTVTLTMFLAVSSAGQEKVIQRSDLPAVVEKAVAAQSQGATIRGFAQVKEHGNLYYEVELMVNGHTKDVQMDPNGAITEVEEQVTIDSLPAAFQRLAIT